MPAQLSGYWRSLYLARQRQAGKRISEINTTGNDMADFIEQKVAPTLKWAELSDQQKVRYVFRVIACVFSMGMIFPNAVIE
jgi:hypothetical protein